MYQRLKTTALQHYKGFICSSVNCIILYIYKFVKRLSQYTSIIGASITKSSRIKASFEEAKDVVGPPDSIEVWT